MSRSSKDFGRFTEALAEECLRKKGYRILERNFKIGKGELDLIAQDGKTMVFVEVKGRRTDRLGGPPYAVDSRKQQQLTKLALAYLAQRGLRNLSCRFDVVLISSPANQPPHITHLQDAFEVSSSVWQW